MTRAVIIGGSGHIGTYLVPRLVEAGFEVVNVTRGKRAPYSPHAAWKKVTTVVADREAEERTGTFGARIRDLKPDIVLDMICFTRASAEHLATALRGKVRHFLHTGTIWVHGHATVVPTSEATPRRPFGTYGIEKAAIEELLLDQARRGDLPATLIHPGHIVGPGWAPVNPAGNFNAAVFTTLARGEELTIPNLGMETVHHVHADDVAQIFMKAIANWSASVGESFHVVSPAAVTLRGFAEAMADWFGREADLAFLPWEEWKARQTDPGDIEATWSHIAHSPNASIAKAARLLDYQPRYTSLEAVRESVAWLVDHGQVKTGKP
ncbi:MAG: NAD-dependent epimerase/dehydratase family protein [Bauldia sp.]